LFLTLRQTFGEVYALFLKMNKIFFQLLFFLIGCHLVHAQVVFNTTLLGNWDDPNLINFSSQKYNDCWGYAADGREYAIMGSIRKVHFFDITDPSEIVEIASFEAPLQSANSIWRDFKTYSHYAYAVADQPGSQEGLLIFDLSDLPNSVTLVNQMNIHFQRAHNIFIEEEYGRLYVAGSNTASGGVIIYDLTVDPEEPELIGSPGLNGGYIHDIFVRDNIGYASHGTIGRFRVHDLSNAQVPVQLGSLTNYPDAGYNHSSWLTEDGKHTVFCDENFGRTVKIANVEDFQNMSVVSTFKSELLAPEHTNSIAHNPFIKEDYVYVAYYHDGLQVFDISDPENVIRIAFYDTYPENTSYSGFFGAWGTYPFLPSGNIIVSDMLNGLFVVKLNEDIFLSANILEFESAKQDNGILVHWKAEEEEGLEAYELQRIHQNDVVTIGNLVAKGTNRAQSYQHLDINPRPGVNYYRLKMIHKDGSETFSGLISRRWTQDFNPIALFPTILSAGGEVNLQIDDSMKLGLTQLSIFNMTGATVQQLIVDFNATNTVKIKMAETLQPGHYLISLLGQNQTTPEIRRFIIK